MHLRRFTLYGDPLRERPTLVERTWAKVKRGEARECWPFMGSIHSSGYGIIRSGGRKAQQEHKVHRVIYEDAVGPIAESWTVDHTCHWQDDTCLGGPTCLHRRCVNPAHLQAVPSEVNASRARSAKRLTFEQATRCAHGHPWNEVNTYRKPNGYRMCRACQRERMRRRRAGPK